MLRPLPFALLIHVPALLGLGTGASAIYALLGCRLHAEWTFTATELDPTSVTLAEDNIRTNGLQDRIAVVTRRSVCLSGCLVACSPVACFHP